MFTPILDSSQRRPLYEQLYRYIRFSDSSRQCKFGIKYAQLHFTRKAGMVNILTVKPLGNQNISPIISQTRLALQLKHFVLSQFTIVFHIDKNRYVPPPPISKRYIDYYSSSS